jgi:tRNA-dihydrouridine synthase B
MNVCQDIKPLIYPALPAYVHTPLVINAVNAPPVALHSRVVLAPMAGVTDVVFRGLVRELAPQSLICTEMISSNGLVYSKAWDANILDQSLNDPPIAYQLAASRLEVLLEAAEGILQRHQPTTLDINMGCPVKKITGNFEGCALMKDLDHAHLLLSSLVKAVPVPVTVKCRLGWDEHSKNYLEFGRMAQDAGVALLTLHARTRAQGYKPGVQWEAFADLKRELTIPIIANGDIVTYDDVATVFNRYGVDGVMIGRGCQGEPWRIGLLHHFIQTGERLPEPSLAERLQLGLRHTEAMVRYKGERVGVREMRGQLPWYVKGFAGASRFRGALTQVSTLADVRLLMDELLNLVPA